MFHPGDELTWDDVEHPHATKLRKLLKDNKTPYKEYEEKTKDGKFKKFVVET
jgi:hypothetical protein